MRSAYGFLWHERRFGVFVVVSLLPRLGFFMVPLGLLLYVRAQTGSVAYAGFALGAFGLASATLPLRGRLVDRYGRVVVATLGIANAGALLLVLVVGHSRWALIAACALVGALIPPLGAYTRAALAGALRDDFARMSSAFAVDSALSECALVLGPLLVAAAVALGGTRVAIVVAALMIELGTIALSLTRVARETATGPATPGGAEADGGRHVQGRATIRVVLAATLCVTIALGVLDVAVPIFATRHGSVADAGLLLGLLAAGTAFGSLWYGSRAHEGELERRLTNYTAPLVACLGVMTIVTSPLILGALLVLTGMAIGPLFVVLFALIQRAARERELTRAFAWEVTITNTGAALGSAGAGVVISAASVHAALGAATASAAVGLMIGLGLTLSVLQEPAHDPAQS